MNGVQHEIKRKVVFQREITDVLHVRGASTRPLYSTELLAECKTLHGCNTGEAKITGANDILYADHIIHTVGPVYSGTNQDAELISSCYRNSLDVALENNCKSIAFSGISTGVYGYPLDEAAKTSLRTAVKWLDAHPKVVMNIYFCCFKEKEMKAYMKLTNG